MAEMAWWQAKKRRITRGVGSTRITSCLFGYVSPRTDWADAFKPRRLLTTLQGICTPSSQLATELCRMTRKWLGDVLAVAAFLLGDRGLTYSITVACERVLCGSARKTQELPQILVEWDKTELIIEIGKRPSTTPSWPFHSICLFSSQTLDRRWCISRAPVIHAETAFKL